MAVKMERERERERDRERERERNQVSYCRALAFVVDPVKMFLVPSLIAMRNLVVVSHLVLSVRM